MNTRSYVVKVSVGDVSYAKVWDPKEPFSVGHPSRWSLEQTEAGVEIKHLEDDSKVGKVLKFEQIKKSPTIDLPETNGKKSPYTVEIKPVETLPPAFQTHPDHGSELRIYSCRGTWTFGCDTISDKFQGMVNRQRMFTITKTGPKSYSIISRVDGLEISTPRKSSSNTHKLANKEYEEFEGNALAGGVIRYGDYEWHLDILDAASVDSIEKAVASELDAESVTMKKSFQYAMSALGVMILLSYFFPKEETPVPPAPQKTKILFTKKIVQGLMTAAPKGDKNSEDFSIGSRGSKKSAGQKGGAGPKKFAEVSPKEKQSKSQSKAVAKAKTTPKKSPNKSVAAPTQVAKKTNKSPGPKANRPHSTQVASKNRSTRSGVRVAQAKPAPTFNASALRQASRGLLKGGMTNLLARSKFSQGSDSRAESQGVVRSGGGAGLSGLGGTSALSDGRMGARSAEVSGFGGGGGGGGDGDGGPGSRGAGYGRGSHAKVSGQGRSFVSLDDGASDVDAGLTKDQVGRVIHQHMSEIRYCYEAATVRNPNVEGKLTLRFAINASGRVKSTGVAGSSVGDDRLDNCIMQRLGRWQFPRPKGGVDVAVTYPFIFKTI